MIDSTPLSSDHLFVLTHLETILPDGSFLDELVCNRLKVHISYKFIVDVADISTTFNLYCDIVDLRKVSSFLSSEKKFQPYMMSHEWLIKS